MGIMAVSSAKAQLSIGPGLVYGTKIEEVGLTANVNYDIDQKFGAMVGGTYYYPKNSVNWWSLDVDGTYSLDKNNVDWYALAGLNLLYYNYSQNLHANYTGFNLGIGWKVKITDKIKLVPEWRYTISDFSYFRFGTKVMFNL